jgi:hypothetical protein
MLRLESDEHYKMATLVFLNRSPTVAKVRYRFELP